MNDLTSIAAQLNTAHAQIVAGNGQLAKVLIAHPLCEGEIYLHGAHVTHWQPHGAEAVLWVSPNSVYSPGKAVRGGVPICFPWFGPKADDPAAPAHGFVRNREWALVHISDDDTGVQVHLRTQSDESTRSQWSADFTADFLAHFGRTLTMRLVVTNTGAQPATLTEALHTYFNVSDVRQISVTGLENTDYISKVDGGARKTQPAMPITFAAETDRVYVNTTAACTIHDTQLGRRIVVEKRGSNSTVVWNPFPKRAAELKDIGEANYPYFVCIETANALENAVTVAPGATHEIVQIVSLKPIENA